MEGSAYGTEFNMANIFFIYSFFLNKKNTMWMSLHKTQNNTLK